MTITWNLDELQSRVPGALLLTDADRDGYEVDGLLPTAVVRPADADEVAAVLRFASEQGLSVTPRGGGTAICAGNRPSRLDLIVDMTRLNRILEHRPQDLTVTVEAGVRMDDLQAALAEHGQMLALDPPCSTRATVGGVLASNSTGPRRYRYGTARDLLIGSRALLADGTPVRSGGKVVKNVAGYDLNKLWIGSRGTLAVIVEATFKVMPAPAELGMVMASFASPVEAHAVAMSVAGSRLQPLGLDLIGPAAARRLTVESRFGTADDAWLLVAELGGPDPVVERTRHELLQMATAGGATSVASPERSQHERLMQRIRDFGRSPPEDHADWIVQVSVLPSETAHAIAAVQEAVGGSLPPVIARAGNGVVYCYLSDGDARDVPTMVERLRGRIDGSVVVEQAPAAMKDGLDVWRLTGPDHALMQRVKEAYDPAGILSPGRVV